MNENGDLEKVYTQDDFYEGQEVYILGEGNEIFTISQYGWDGRKCWAGDEDGRGWYVYFSQLRPVNE